MILHEHRARHHRRAGPHGPALPGRARRRALLALVLLQGRRCPPSGTRARVGSGTPLHQPPEQLHRLAAGWRSPRPQGPLPRDRGAVPEPDRRALPRGVRRDPGPPEGGPTARGRRRPRGPGGPGGAERGDVRGLPRGLRARSRRRHLPRGHDPRGGAGRADQDGCGAHGARVRRRAPRRAPRRAGGAQLRGAQVVPRARARLVRPACPGHALPRRLPRGRGQRGRGAHDGDPVGDGGRGRPRRADRGARPRPRRRGALPGRPRARAHGSARARAGPDRPRAPVARDRGRGESLQGARPGARRAALAADPELSRAARRVPGEGRGRARAPPAPGTPRADPPGLGGPRRLPALRLRCLRERRRLLAAALGRPPHVAQGDRLRDLALSRLDRRLPALLGPRDLDRLAPRGRLLGGGLRRLAAALGCPRVPLLGGGGPPPEPAALRVARAHPRARGPAARRRAAGDPRRARARQDRLPERDERELLLSLHLLEEMSTPALDALDRARTVIILTVSPLETHGPHLPVGVDAIAARHFAERVAERLAAARPGWSAVLAPTLHLGSFTFHSVGTVGVRQRVVRDAVLDYGDALGRAGFRYILVANGHGGPGHLVALEEAAATVSRRHGITMASFTGRLAWDFLRGRYLVKIEAALGRALTDEERRAFAEDAHGGWWETSLMLMLRPDLVDDVYPRFRRRAIRGPSGPCGTTRC